MKFNPENLTSRNSPEFKMLQRRRDKILELKRITKDLENEYDILFIDMKLGKEPNSFVEEEFAKLQNE